MACDATDAPTPIVTAARARFVSAFAAALDIARRRVASTGVHICDWARPVRDSIVWANSVTVTSRMRFTIRDSRARHTATPRRRHRMAESQWEHQAKFAGELFLGASALVGAYLCFMCAHLRGERRARLARRAAAAARGGEAGTRDERARLVGGGAERGGGVV